MSKIPYDPEDYKAENGEPWSKQTEAFGLPRWLRVTAKESEESKWRPVIEKGVQNILSKPEKDGPLLLENAVMQQLEKRDIPGDRVALRAEIDAVYRETADASPQQRFDKLVNLVLTQIVPETNVKVER